jgi:hypothetical protein
MTSFIASKTDIGVDPIPATSYAEVGVNHIAQTLSKDIGLDPT